MSSFWSVNPATGRRISQYHYLDAERIEAELTAAAHCFADSRCTPLSVRKERMLRVANLLEEHVESLAGLITAEMGKVRSEAHAEVEKCARVCRYYAEHAASMLDDEPVATEATTSFVRYEPLGPVLAVMPWNFPFWQVFRFAAPALMAGNVVLLKHASNVPGSALAIADLFVHAGFSPGSFSTLLIESRRVAAIIADDRVAGVTLTGSEGAGRAVGSAAGEAIKPVVLELGGSDPFIVMNSADINRAVAIGVQSRMLNNGQSCIAAKRFLLHRTIADEYVDKFAARLAGLQIGDPSDPTTEIGPLARPEFRDEVDDQVRRTLQEGGLLVCGGRTLERDGYYYEPTLVDRVEPGMPLFDEETFGPVASVTRVSDCEEALSLANRSLFGLGASFWSSDSEEIDRAVATIAAGSVFINDMVRSDPRLPFGGIRRSGVGRELARFGMHAFLNIKTVYRA